MNHRSQNLLWIHRVANDERLLEIGRQAVEATLIDWRDSRISEIGRANGLVIREKDGSESSVIRFGPEMALRIGLKAIAEELSRRESV